MEKKGCGYRFVFVYSEIKTLGYMRQGEKKKKEQAINIIKIFRFTAFFFL